MFNTLAVFLLQMEKDLERLYATKDCPDRSIVNSIAHRMRPNLELFCMEVLKIELEGLLAAFETQNSALWGVRILEFIELSQRELNFVRSSVDLTEKVR
jgi:polynucleotide 5'-kinase involved in rRNA processing